MTNECYISLGQCFRSIPDLWSLLSMKLKKNTLFQLISLCIVYLIHLANSNPLEPLSAGPLKNTSARGKTFTSSHGRLRPLQMFYWVRKLKLSICTNNRRHKKCYLQLTGQVDRYRVLLSCFGFLHGCVLMPSPEKARKHSTAHIYCSITRASNASNSHELIVLTIIARND